MRTAKQIVASPGKLLYLVLGVFCLVLGVIGLVLPIIPGVLFLVGAVYLLGKVSSRVRRWGDSNATFRGINTRFERMGQIGLVDRLKVLTLMGAETLVRGLDMMADAVARLMPKRTP